MDPSRDNSLVDRVDEAELNQLLSLFDAPAFARRGHDLEYALGRLHLRLAHERAGMLDMVKTRLRQWSSVAVGPDDWMGVFAEPVEPLYLLTGADPPSWSSQPAPDRRRRAVARDLAASVERFNRRWLPFLDGLRLDSINRQIKAYNTNYVFEKECVLGSARLAVRNFVPQPAVARETLLILYPTLPVVTASG